MSTFVIDAGARGGRHRVGTVIVVLEVTGAKAIVGEELGLRPTSLNCIKEKDKKIKGCWSMEVHSRWYTGAGAGHRTSDYAETGESGGNCCPRVAGLELEGLLLSSSSPARLLGVIGQSWDRENKIKDKIRRTC